jgi:peptidoglycan/xylan/chitin deacetylase (PgdA/CDA1 family)
MAHREFGHRVGVFRLLDGLARHGVTPAAVVDVLTAEHYPALLDHLLPAVGEVVAGGLSASRPVTSAMAEDEERDYVELTLDRLAAATGTRPAGWLGPEHSESTRTPRLLAEAGLRYVADWGNDELPYPMTGAGGELWGFPLSWELSDQAAAFLRGVAPSTWAASVATAFDVLHDGGGRVFALHLHPWVSGQAYRAGSVERVLAHLAGADQVWFASPAAIVEHCRAQVAG